MSKQVETLKTFFKTLLNRYQNNLEISMRGNVFFFDCISPDWMKNKKSSNKLYQ